jgi:hypothetical protein
MTCPHHDAAHVCEHCPEAYDTDNRGFVHRLELKGRVPLRKCHGCGKLKPPGEWSAGGFGVSVRNWNSCAECAPGLPPETPPPKKRKKP